MRTWTETHREGTDCGPVDWEHPLAAALDEKLHETLKEAEKNPAGFVYCPSGFSTFQIVSVCMYDGWPYWQPRPAFSYVGPLRGIEWAFFDSYGVHAGSVFRGKPATPFGPSAQTKCVEQKEK